MPRYSDAVVVSCDATRACECIGSLGVVFGIGAMAINVTHENIVSDFCSKVKYEMKLFFCCKLLGINDLHDPVLPGGRKSLVVSDLGKRLA